MMTEEENLTRNRLWMLYGRVVPSPDDEDFDMLIRFNFIKQIHNTTLRLATTLDYYDNLLLLCNR
jgi:hypothetical protein